MRRLLCGLWCLLLLLGAPATVWASEAGEAAQALLEESGVLSLTDELPPDTAASLEDLGLSASDPDSFQNLSLPALLESLWEAFTGSIREEALPWGAAVGAVLFAALGREAALLFASPKSARLYQTVAVLVLAGALVRPLADLAQEGVEAAAAIGHFLQSFLPVFAAAVSVSGMPASALLSEGMVLGLSELFALLVPQVFLPLLYAYLAVALSACSGSGLSVSGLTGGIRSLLLWGLGILTTVYSAVLAVRGFTAQAADSLTLRTGRYLAGSLIPVVGKTLSDTAAAFSGALSLVRSTVGAFGIAAVLLLTLFPVLKLLWAMLCLKLSAILAEALALEPVLQLLEAANFVLSVFAGLLSLYGLMIILSLALLLGMGVSA